MIRLVIPSHKRADNVLTSKIFPSAVVCVPEAQADEYRAHNPNTEIVAHPDSVVGISPKRQWMWEYFGDQVQLDDDIISVHRVYRAKGGATGLTGEQAVGLLNDLYEISKELGIKLFGVNNIANPVVYDGSSPIEFNKFVTGGLMGLIRDKNLYFPDAPFFVGEDVWINLLHAHFYRMSYVDTRFAVGYAKTERAQGGCADFRTEERRRESYYLLRRAFGDGVALKQGGALKKTYNKWEKTIKIPY